MRPARPLLQDASARRMAARDRWNGQLGVWAPPLWFCSSRARPYPATSLRHISRPGPSAVSLWTSARLLPEAQTIRPGRAVCVVLPAPASAFAHIRLRHSQPSIDAAAAAQPCAPRAAFCIQSDRHGRLSCGFAWKGRSARPVLGTVAPLFRDGEPGVSFVQNETPAREHQHEPGTVGVAVPLLGEGADSSTPSFCPLSRAASPSAP